jgi:hypothetical protein
VPKGTAVPFYEKGNVRIRYEMVGSGFPLLVTPGGGLNSRVSNWPTAVFNAMEAFKDDFRRDAPQADSRQCGRALRAGKSISRSVDCGHRGGSTRRPVEGVAAV